MATSSPKIKVLQLPYNKPAEVAQVGVQKNKTRYDDLLLDNIMSVISDQSLHLNLNEEMWTMSKKEKERVEGCFTPSGRSSGFSDSYPSIHKIENWSKEKNFWLTYLPRQQRIKEYETGNVNKWDSYENNLKEAKVKFQSTKSGSLNNIQLKRQADWENKMLDQFNRRHQLRDQKLRNRELALTLHRYRDFTKNLLGNLKDTQTATNNMGLLDSGAIRRPLRYHQAEMERIENGYNLLKDLYVMNPELVVQLALKHIKAGPGKRWMGLSRDDIKEVLEHLASGCGDPNYSPYPELKRTFIETRNPLGFRDYLSSSSRLSLPSRIDFLSSKVSSENPNKITVEVAREPRTIMRKAPGPFVKKNRPLKPHQLMPLHIPGPDRLHQNVCVRAYSTEMDGPDSDLYGGVVAMKKIPKKIRGKRKKIKVRRLKSVTSNSNKTVLSEEDPDLSISVKTGDDDSEEETFTLGFESGDDEEGITIESFIPNFTNSY